MQIIRHLGHVCVSISLFVFPLPGTSSLLNPVILVFWSKDAGPPAPALVVGSSRVCIAASGLDGVKKSCPLDFAGISHAGVAETCGN